MWRLHQYFLFYFFFSFFRFYFTHFLTLVIAGNGAQRFIDINFFCFDICWRISDRFFSATRLRCKWSKNVSENCLNNAKKIFFYLNFQVQILPGLTYFMSQFRYTLNHSFSADLKITLLSREKMFTINKINI